MKYFLIDNSNVTAYLPKMVEAHGHPNVTATEIFDNTDEENPVTTGNSLVQFDPSNLPDGFVPATGFSATGYTDEEIKILLEQYEAEQVTLRIYNYKVLPLDDLKDFDFTLLGLHGYDTHIKGRKTIREYFAPEDGNTLVIKKTFIDVPEEGLFDHIHMIIEWYNTDGTVGLIKEVDITMTSVQKAQHLYDRRRRAISYLSLFAKGTPLETYVDTLLTAYATEINQYLNSGTTDFADALTNETDPTLLAILNTVANPELGHTVRDGILYNI